MDRHLNFVCGAWTRSSGGTFVPDAGPDREPWPLTSEADWAAALTAARPAAQAWARLDAPGRDAIVASFGANLQIELDAWSPVGRALGLDPWEWGPLGARVAGRVPGERSLPRRTAAIEAREGPVEVRALAPHWADFGLSGEVGAAGPEPDAAASAGLFGALGSGRAVVLLPDPRLPSLGEAVARAWAACGAPTSVSGLVQVLHGGGAKLLDRLPAAPWLERRGSGTEHELSGLTERSGLRVIRNRSFWVGPEADPVQAVGPVAEAAFGRATALGGQAPDQIGRVYCAPELLSRFTAALLETLDAAYDEAPPLRLIDDEAAEDLRSAQFLGLDQGATEIFGPPGGGSESERSPLPLVFTNVEPDARLLRRRRPAPVLALVRWEAGMAGPGQEQR